MTALREVMLACANLMVGLAAFDDRTGVPFV